MTTKATPAQIHKAVKELEERCGMIRSETRCHLKNWVHLWLEHFEGAIELFHNFRLTFLPLPKDLDESDDLDDLLRRVYFGYNQFLLTLEKAAKDPKQEHEDPEAYEKRHKALTETRNGLRIIVDDVSIVAKNYNVGLKPANPDAVEFFYKLSCPKIDFERLGWFYAMLQQVVDYSDKCAEAFGTLVKKGKV